MRLALAFVLALGGCATQLIVPSGDGGGADAAGVPCSNGACGADSECEFTDGNCAGSTGMCVAMPKDGCPPQVFAPVCDCNGQTHPSDCFAWLAGSAVAHTGPCVGGL